MYTQVPWVKCYVPSHTHILLHTVVLCTLLSRVYTQVPWVKCYVPSHLATAPHLGGAATSSPWMRRPTVHVTGLAYSQSGDRLLASYSHEDIYLFR